MCDYNQKLIESAKIGNLEDVKECIKNGAYLYTGDIVCGSMAIHWAAQSGHIIIVEYLLSLVDIDVRGNNNETALSFASRANRMEIVKLLVERKANLNAKSYYGTPIIDLAIQCNNYEIVQYLLYNGAQLNANSDIPSILRCWCNTDTKIIELLLDHKCNINENGENGSTLFHYIAYHNDSNADLIPYLIKHDIDINLRDNSGENAIIIATRHKNSDVVLKLLECGAEKYIENYVLSIAITNEDYTTLSMLLLYDYNGINDTGYKVLDIYEYSLIGSTLCNFLISITNNTIELNIPYSGRTIISSTIKVNIPDITGTTALMYAIGRQNIIAINLLLNYDNEYGGLDYFVTNSYGYSVISLAYRHNNRQIIDKLVWIYRMNERLDNIFNVHLSNIICQYIVYNYNSKKKAILHDLFEYNL